jgi:(p)ppGpp synthase/HD superfamily hydrolase
MTWSSEKAIEALRFAATAHGDQKVAGTGHPYIVHVVSVCTELMAALRAEPGRDEQLAVCCALLHDVVEDTATKLDDIERAFGAAVAAGVAALTKTNGMADSLRRIREQPHEVWMVKLADRVVNLTPPAPPHWTVDKKQRYRDEGRQIVEALGEASPHLAAKLRRRIDEYPTE